MAKLTESQLRKIIKQELSYILREANELDKPTSNTSLDSIDKETYKLYNPPFTANADQIVKELGNALTLAQKMKDLGSMFGLSKTAKLLGMEFAATAILKAAAKDLHAVRAEIWSLPNEQREELKDYLLYNPDARPKNTQEQMWANALFVRPETKKN
jgi:hypothetical protein